MGVLGPHKPLLQDRPVYLAHFHFRMRSFPLRLQGHSGRRAREAHALNISKLAALKCLSDPPVRCLEHHPREPNEALRPACKRRQQRAVVRLCPPIRR